MRSGARRGRHPRHGRADDARPHPRRRSRRDGAGLPTLRSLAYGGGPDAASGDRAGHGRSSTVDLVNAYGLTETSSTIAVLGPTTTGRPSPATTRRCGRGSARSAARLPGVEVSIRDAEGAAAARRRAWARSGCAASRCPASTSDDAGLDDGWFNTRDAGHLDGDGYLFVHGRLDDVIVRGGENLSPGRDRGRAPRAPRGRPAAVVGIPDAEWGEQVVAAVVLAPRASSSTRRCREHVRRSACARPERLSASRPGRPAVQRDGEAPARHVLREELADQFG